MVLTGDGLPHSKKGVFRPLSLNANSVVHFEGEPRFRSNDVIGTFVLSGFCALLSIQTSNQHGGGSEGTYLWLRYLLFLPWPFWLDSSKACLTNGYGKLGWNWFAFCATSEHTLRCQAVRTYSPCQHVVNSWASPCMAECPWPWEPLAEVVFDDECLFGIKLVPGYHRVPHRCRLDQGTLLRVGQQAEIVVIRLHAPCCWAVQEADDTDSAPLTQCLPR